MEKKLVSKTNKSKDLRMEKKADDKVNAFAKVKGKGKDMKPGKPTMVLKGLKDVKFDKDDLKKKKKR